MLWVFGLTVGSIVITGVTGVLFFLGRQPENVPKIAAITCVVFGVLSVVGAIAMAFFVLTPH